MGPTAVISQISNLAFAPSNGYIHFQFQQTLFKHSLIRLHLSKSLFSPLPSPQQHQLNPQTPILHTHLRSFKLRPLNNLSFAAPVQYNPRRHPCSSALLITEADLRFE
ncbi:hypothetical protein ACJW31_10G109300 [Castanea mollissima]